MEKLKNLAQRSETMGLFGRGRKEAWQEVAEEMGFQLVEGGFFKTDKIIGDINYLSRLPKKIQKKKGIILGHTARNPEDYTSAMKKITNVVFEGFNPKEL